MEHQRQGPYECLPTVVGMLIDMPKDSVIKLALPRDASKWTELFGKDGVKFWETSRILLDCAFGDGFATQYLMASNVWYSRTMCPDGKGILKLRKGTRRVGHVVAFNDGYVYDAEFPERMAYAEWRAHPRIKGWRIVGVVTVPDAPEKNP